MVFYGLTVVDSHNMLLPSFSTKGKTENMYAVVDFY